MKTIGLIGGTTWHSTVDYYRIINQLTHQRLGGINSAKILMYSVNFHEFRPAADSWDRIGNDLSAIAKKLEEAGANCILLCANTPHMVAGTIQQNINIPLIHIAEVTSKEIVSKGINKVALLGTKFTMEENFFKEKLTGSGIGALIPGDSDRDFIHASIFDELGVGVFKPETKARYLQIIKDLQAQGAQGAIFGCTEIPLLIPPDECDFAVFDTLALHAKAAVDFALS
jgi:aspartate racemase